MVYPLFVYSIILRVHTEKIICDHPKTIKSLLSRTKSHYSAAETDIFLPCHIYFICFKYVSSGYNKVHFTGMWPLYQWIHII